jgi:type IV secretory pathway protease TraF
MKKVVVEGFELEITSPPNNTIGSFTVVSIPTNKVLSEDKRCYFGNLSCMVSGIVDSNTGNTQTAPINITISGTSEKLMLGSDKAVLEGDSVDVTIDGISPSNVTVSWPVTISIKNANQDKLITN